MVWPKPTPALAGRVAARSGYLLVCSFSRASLDIRAGIPLSSKLPRVPFRPIHVEITLGPDRGLAGPRDTYPGIVLELPGDERVTDKDLPRFPATGNAMRSRCIAWKGSYLGCENSTPSFPVCK